MVEAVAVVRAPHEWPLRTQRHLQPILELAPHRPKLLRASSLEALPGEAVHRGCTGVYSAERHHEPLEARRLSARRIGNVHGNLHDLGVRSDPGRLEVVGETRDVKLIGSTGAQRVAAGALVHSGQWCRQAAGSVPRERVGERRGEPEQWRLHDRVLMGDERADGDSVMMRRALVAREKEGHQLVQLSGPRGSRGTKSPHCS